jgi:hypothetical protein
MAQQDAVLALMMAMISSLADLGAKQVSNPEGVKSIDLGLALKDFNQLLTDLGAPDADAMGACTYSMGSVKYCKYTTKSVCYDVYHGTSWVQNMPCPPN